MPDLGLLLAITPADVAALLAREGDDEALADYVGDVLEPETPAELTGETDQAWDAIHRSLTDGTLTFGGEQRTPTPLARCILGGRLLTSGEDYLVVLTEAAEVSVSAPSKIDPDEYGPSYGPGDLDYAWQWFQQARALWARAAQGSLAVVFTAGL